MMALAAVLAAGCKTKTKAPTREQIMADSLKAVKAKLDSSIKAQNAAMLKASAEGDDDALLAAMNQLFALHDIESENEKSLELIEAKLAAQEKDTEKAIAKDVKEEANKKVEEKAPVVEKMGVEKDAQGNEIIPFAKVSEKPTFKDKDANSFSKWVSRNIEYPKEAVDQKLEGTSVIKFLVNKDGSVSNVQVLKSAGELLDKEAVRVISKSPKWSAGLQNGEAVPVSYTFPVVFKLAQ